VEKLLMTPGPTNIPNDVFNKMSLNIHHRTDEFDEIYKNVNIKLKRLFGCKNDLALLLSSGTGGLEASVVNLFSKGDKLLVLNCGVFGKRFADIARIYGVDVHEKIVEWGKGVIEDELRQELEKEKYKAVYATYSETSTGVKNDIKKLGQVVKNYDSLFIVDIVSALGCVEFNADEFSVDAAIAGSQKGLMCPPGLSIISLSDSAWDAIYNSTIPKFYFDLKKYKDLNMPYTPGTSLILGLDESLNIIEHNGIDNIIKRHKRHSDIVKYGCKLMGLKEFPDSRFNSEILTALYVPEGLSAKEIIKEMSKQGIVIAGGQGKLKGKIIRIGHMGYVKDEYIIKTMKGLGTSLNTIGYKNDTDNIVKQIENMLEAQK
jgi:aspartate aminotransferase-like enzyme